MFPYPPILCSRWRRHPSGRSFASASFCKRVRACATDYSTRELRTPSILAFLVGWRIPSHLERFFWQNVIAPYGDTCDATMGFSLCNSDPQTRKHLVIEQEPCYCFVPRRRPRLRPRPSLLESAVHPSPVLARTGDRFPPQTSPQTSPHPPRIPPPRSPHPYPHPHPHHPRPLLPPHHHLRFRSHRISPNPSTRFCWVST